MTSSQPERDVNRGPEDENSTDLAKTYFDYYKHFTTLSATAAVGVATLSHVADITDATIGVCLVGFGTCLFLSLLGMYRCLRIFETDPYMQEGGSVRAQKVLTAIVVVSFLAGIATFVQGALQKPSGWGGLLIGLIGIIGSQVVFVVLIVYRSG